MELDDELCLCFHVSKRKVVNFIRVEKPARVGQLSECFGAGTGCGWCRFLLQRLFDEAESRRKSPAGESQSLQSGAEMTAAEYARRRAAYVRAGGGTPPPGATPLDPMQEIP